MPAFSTGPAVQQLIEEVHSKRVSTNEHAVIKKNNVRQKVSDKESTLDDFLFPVKAEAWHQPLDGRKI